MTRRRPCVSGQGTSVLKEYLESVKKVRNFGKMSNLSEMEIDSVMDECMETIIKLKTDEEKVSAACVKKIKSYFKKLLIFSVSFLATILILYVVLQYKPVQYFIQSKLQDFIYPDFYDESCLVSNPFFRVPDMSCPCEEVRAIMNLTGENTQLEQYHSGIPFMIKISREEISWEKLKSLYDNHSAVFDRDASHLLISSPFNREVQGTPASLFSSEWDITQSNWAQTHIQWRCNRMEPTRLLRSIFGVPESEPNYAAGVTLEKIVLLDGPQAPSYLMPTTDGTTVFMHQTSGSRMIVLNPANECKDLCTAVSVELPANHILWFSWWYWRATSMPSPSSISISVAYMGSYL